MIRVRFAAALVLLLVAGCRAEAPPATVAGPVAGPVAEARDTVAAAVRDRAQDVPVDGRGVVARVLRDDTHGSPHQRFLLRLDDGTTVLVAHNVALAPRLEGLAEGDVVAFRGEYVWNPKGGTVHWTHHDPRGRHPGGWLRWNGRTYD